MSPLENFVKRAIDIAFAALLLAISGGVMLALAGLVRTLLGSPVLFRQTRPGLHAIPFEILKFRTMTNERGVDGKLLPDADRLTRFGRFLRRTSLDELPQLLNVITGELSLVGPRPLLMEYLAHYTPEQARRHDVKPGITGWAQVNGRNALTWPEKFALDVWYVDNQSLLVDFKIMVMTVTKVLKSTHVHGVGNVPFTETTSGKDRSSGDLS